MLAPCAVTAQGVLSNNPHWVRTNYTFDPETICSQGGFLFSGGEGGAFRSSDDGNTWEAVNTGFHSDIDPCEVISFYSCGNYLLAYVLYSGGVYFPEQGIKTFMEHCSKKIGNAYFQTPRNTVKAFVDMLFVIEQNPQLDISNLIGQIAIDSDNSGALDLEENVTEPADAEVDELATLRI